jgi:hypothetical protein
LAGFVLSAVKRESVKESFCLFVSQLRISEKFLGGFASCGGKRIRFFRIASPNKKTFD